MSKLVARTDVASPVTMPPEVSAWFSEQTKRLTRNRSFTDAFALHGGPMLPGKPPKTNSSILDSIMDSITRLGTKLDSSTARLAKTVDVAKPAPKPAAKVAAPALRADSAEVIATNTRIAALKKEIDNMKTHLPAEVPADQKGLFIAAQANWERVAEAFGDAQMRRPLVGESPADYERALASPYKVHSKAWKDINLYEVPDQVVDVAINQIRADALQAAANPPVTEGKLTMRQRRDDAGRVINSFHGDIGVMLDLSRNPRKYVTGFPALAAR